MKKFLFVVCIFAAVVACKKKKESNTFEATDVTGISVIKGNVSKTLISSNGNGGWSNNLRVPARNIRVSVTIKRSSLFPNSNASGADVYSAQTDSAGNYSIPVRSNAGGVPATISIDGFSGTVDTLINGSIKPGLNSVFTGTTVNTTLIMGQNFNLNYVFTASNAVTNPVMTEQGTAVVSGSVGIEYLQETVIGTNPPFYNPIIVPIPAGQKVLLRLDKDPVSLVPKTYETTTDGNGYYQFTLNTVAQGTQGFLQNATIWIEDKEATRDTIKVNKTVKTGIKGVYQMDSRTQNGVYKNTIKNANHLAYSVFVPN
jgi:hypothetical protein